MSGSFDLPSSNDDIYVNEGSSYDNGVYYPNAPEERLEAEREDSAKKSASYPVLKEIASWFERQIQACDSMDNIQIETLEVNGVKFSRTVSVEAQVLAMQLLKQQLQMQYEEYKTFQEEHDA